MGAILSGQDRGAYPDAIRDWVGAWRRQRLRPQPDRGHHPVATAAADEVEGAAHFELANQLWRTGRRDLAIGHFRECHRLQPENWTYKRQAWSLVGNERFGGEFGRFVQGPIEGEEDSWPFDSDFRSDVAMLDEGAYYPKTM